MAVAQAGRGSVRRGARTPSPASMVHALLVIAGAVAGVRLAFPVADVRAACPGQGEAGYGLCLLDKAWLPAAIKVVLTISAGHVVGSFVLWTAPGVVRSRRDRRGRTARLAARRAGQPARVERRVEPRSPLALRVEVRRGRGGIPIADVRSRDASISGVLLDHVDVVAVGEPVWLSVHLREGRTVEVGARVTRTTRDGGVGLALEGLTPVDRGRLAARIADRK